MTLCVISVFDSKFCHINVADVKSTSAKLAARMKAEEPVTQPTPTQEKQEVVVTNCIHAFLSSLNALLKGMDKPSFYI